MFLRLAKYQRIIASFLLINFLTLLVPIQSKALSSGPAQPETQQFAPAGMDDMVDPFTGDFSYNIPLMDVGGYPINLNYASGITPDAEASWVGLGWNLNVGAINRSVRGLPDDFAGDDLQTDYNIKPNQTYGSKINVSFKAFAFKPDQFFKSVKVGLNANVFYNNYNGMGISVGVNPTLSSTSSQKGDYTANLGVSLNVGSESGLDISPSVGVSHKEKVNGNEQTMAATIGFPFNTRDGLKGMTLSASNTNAKGFTGQTSGFFGFSTPTYTPSIQQSHTNFAMSMGLGIGPATAATEFPALGFEGYYNGQFLVRNESHNQAFGYMYSGIVDSDSKVYDFNREKDGTYHKKYTQNLALTNYTYDIFQVSGQGISGSYRLHRGDVGTVSDPVATDVSNDITTKLDLEIGGPPFTLDVGVGAGYTNMNSKSGKWSSDDNYITKFNSETNPNSPANEEVYFKKMGEATVENDPDFYNNIQKGTNLLKYGLISSTFGYASNNYVSKPNQFKSPSAPSVESNSLASNAVRSSRPNKATSFTYLTAAEATNGNVLPIQEHEINQFGWKQLIDGSTTDKYTSYKNTVTPRVTSDRKGHHISEVRVTDESGARYVYGIPAYNKMQKEITFAASVGSGTINSDVNQVKQSGLIKYNPGDLGNNNKNGLDHYYNCVTTPANAHSYLLTCILSSDYVDSDNIPGPSDGDLGTYTKFNYAKLNSDFKWRTPMSANGNVASYSEGMTDDANVDDKGNIVYGEKEVWYLHSIETPTHVAEFHLSARLDGLGTTGRDGAVGGVALQKLDKIVLYNKADKSNNDPEPIKTVYFSYSYKLCPGTINSNATADASKDQQAKGKLTLDKVWFTYGKSQKGVLNPYVFAYANAGTSADGKMDPQLNPEYSHLNYDRWGNYKLNNPLAPNSSFPYTQQNDKNTVDRNSAVYALSTIYTPTGGSMHVVYESDDYAYVQNKKAMRMFKVANGGDNDVLFNGPIQRDELVIDLGEGFTPSSTDQATINKEFQEKYLGDMDLMYFKVYANVVNVPFSRKEFVPGYAEIIKDQSTASASLIGGKCTRATIKLKLLNAGLSPNVNPISRAGWMYAKMNLSRELKGLKNAESMGAEDIMFALLSQVSSLIFSMTGFTNEMITKGNSGRIDTDKSFVKLLEPDQVKLGGGHRVKAIVMSDNWALMKSVKENTNNNPAKQTSYYGQKYDYTTVENGVTISSGVAAYEPIMGGDENPFRKPIFIEEKVPLAANNIDFLEEPMGECFFPSPTVGYSKVVTTPLKITQSDFVNKIFRSNGTGIVEQEFYTAKDFPTYTERTGLTTSSKSPSLLSKFMKIASTDLVTCSQGYYIELNDMHGKPKSKRVYPQQDASASDKKPNPISEVEYRYKTKGGILDNSVPTVNPDLSIPAQKSDLGVEVDVVNDQREFCSTTLGGGLDVNIKTIVVVLVPVPVPTGFPDITDEYVRFRSLVTTKVVNRFGILEETIAKDNGASISTKNLAWDAKTGAVILTSVQNEFHDPMYTFTYPAHWAYTRMDHASKTDGMVFTNTYFDPNGNPSNMTNASKFSDGDELLLNNTTKAYLNYDKATSKWTMIDKDGNTAPAFTLAKVVRSGSRNMASAPIGTVVMLSNPVQGNQIVFDKVINAGASEYKEEWKRIGCDCKDGSVSQSANPYQIGLKGNLRPYKSWTYLTDRYQRLVNNQMNIRSDGYYKDFAAFWDARSGSTLLTPPTNFVTSKWQYVTEITNYNPLGMEIENRDALNRYMMAQYGYNKKLPVATSNNSKYRESGFDSFEDYDNSKCVDDHFSWRQVNNIELSDREAHTGRKSIKVGPSQEIDLRKVITPCE